MFHLSCEENGLCYAFGTYNCIWEIRHLCCLTRRLLVKAASSSVTIQRFDSKKLWVMDEIKTLLDQCVIPDIKYIDITVVSRRMVNISLLIEL